MVSRESRKDKSKQKAGPYELLRPAPKQQVSSDSRKGVLSISKGQGESGDRALWCRREMKYAISESKARAISHFIRPYVQPDRYCLSQPGGSYPIVSLYLDSEDFKLCRESLTGQKNRFKLRIRSYTDAQDYPRFFEIKRRINTIILKSRTQVFHHNVAPLLSGLLGPPPGDDPEDEPLRHFILYMTKINGKPVVRTRYLRQAFEGIADNRVRVTFDRNLCYKATSGVELGFDGPGWQRLHLNRVILEIKFTGQFPPWLSRMVQSFELRQRSLSKYASSIKQACSLRFCAPTMRRYEL